MKICNPKLFLAFYLWDLNLIFSKILPKLKNQERNLWGASVHLEPKMQMMKESVTGLRGKSPQLTKCTQQMPDAIKAEQRWYNSVWIALILFFFFLVLSLLGKYARTLWSLWNVPYFPHLMTILWPFSSNSLFQERLKRWH